MYSYLDERDLIFLQFERYVTCYFKVSRCIVPIAHDLCKIREKESEGLYIIDSVVQK